MRSYQLVKHSNAIENELIKSEKRLRWRKSIYDSNNKRNKTIIGFYLILFIHSLISFILYVVLFKYQ